LQGSGCRHYSQHYKTKSAKRKGYLDGFLKISSLVFSVLMTLVFAALMSGGFMLRAGDVSQGVTVEARDYYAISFGSYSTVQQAEKAARQLRARGGGGYIQKSGGSYKVFAALYLNKADAQTVCHKIKEGGSDCAVQKIEVPAFKFRYEADKISAHKLGDILEFINFCIEGLYAVFVELDSRMINELDAQVRIEGLKNEAIRLKGELDSLPGQSSHQLIRLKAEFVSLQINLGAISENSLLSENTSVEVKYFMLKIAFSYQSFANEIK